MALTSKAPGLSAAPQEQGPQNVEPSTEHTIGVISDTHSLLRPEAVDYLQGSEIIVHAGDIGSPDVLEVLSEIAPVYAVRGNNDRGDWAQAVPEVEMFEFSGKTIYMVHDPADIDIDPHAAGVDLIVTGHTHHPKLEERDGVIYLNPGSAGPRRFKLPIAIGKVTLKDGELSAELDTLSIG